MPFTDAEKQNIENAIVSSLSGNEEIEKIIIFGSFVDSPAPGDIDIACIEEGPEDYLSLSLKYRKQLRGVSKIIPVDVVPLKKNSSSYFTGEIERGKVIYEK